MVADLNPAIGGSSSPAKLYCHANSILFFQVGSFSFGQFAYSNVGSPVNITLGSYQIAQVFSLGSDAYLHYIISGEGRTYKYSAGAQVLIDTQNSSVPSYIIGAYTAMPGGNKVYWWNTLYNSLITFNGVSYSLVSAPGGGFSFDAGAGFQYLGTPLNSFVAIASARLGTTYDISSGKHQMRKPDHRSVLDQGHQLDWYSKRWNIFNYITNELLCILFHHHWFHRPFFQWPNRYPYIYQR